MDKWKGWIIDESLKDAEILSKLKVLKADIEENGEGDSKSIWKLYTVEVEDKNIKRISEFLEEQIKLEYYIHFTNEKELIIIFSGKFFRIKLDKVGEEKDTGIGSFWAKPEYKKIWEKAVKYGTTKGKVDKRYLIKVF